MNFYYYVICVAYSYVCTFNEPHLFSQAQNIKPVHSDFLFIPVQHVAHSKQFPNNKTNKNTN